MNVEWQDTKGAQIGRATCPTNGNTYEMCVWGSESENDVHWWLEEGGAGFFDGSATGECERLAGTQTAPNDALEPVCRNRAEARLACETKLTSLECEKRPIYLYWDYAWGMLPGRASVGMHPDYRVFIYEGHEDIAEGHHDCAWFYTLLRNSDGFMGHDGQDNGWKTEKEAQDAAKSFLAKCLGLSVGEGMPE